MNPGKTLAAGLVAVLTLAMCTEATQAASWRFRVGPRFYGYRVYSPRFYGVGFVPGYYYPPPALSITVAAPRTYLYATSGAYYYSPPVNYNPAGIPATTMPYAEPVPAPSVRGEAVPPPRRVVPEKVMAPTPSAPGQAPPPPPPLPPLQPGAGSPQTP